MIEVEKFRFKKEGFETFFSPLESDILDILWERKSVKVRYIHTVLRKKKKVALTSIAVSLDRLYKKGVVDRDIETGRGGQHYIYIARKSKKEIEKSLMDNVVNKLIGNFGNVAVNYFNERFGKKKG
ncbi:MAG: BlaI/MecI/CopY family transcriptional regulator [Candidatus Mariimomonas ferrooxydans]